MKYDTDIVVDVDGTVEAIEAMSTILADYSKQIYWVAEKMKATKDISYSGEALNCVANCISNLRIDLLATRPIRAYDRAWRYAKAKEDAE